MKTENLQVAAGQGSTSLASAAARIFWHSFRETTGAAAAVYKITDGNQPGARILLTVSLAAGESTRDYFGKHGLPVENGIYFLLVSGAVEGNINSAFEDVYQSWCQPVMVVNMQPPLGT